MNQQKEREGKKMKYNAEYVRGRVGGSHKKAVEVFALVAMIYEIKSAPARAWERAIQLTKNAK